MRLTFTAAISIGLLIQLFPTESAAQTYPLRPDLCPVDSTLERNLHEYTDTGTVLFWLDNAVANVGRGPLHLLGGDTLSTDPLTVRALQKIEIAEDEFAYDSVGT